jgi:uncharacterized protein (DUF362 family)
MREMNRRTFLVATGKWLAVAGVAGAVPALSGCARLLRWSESQGHPSEGAEDTSTAGTVGATTTLPASTSTTSTTSTTGTASGSTSSTTSTTAFIPPDLAVFSGEQPDLNVRAAIEALGGMSRFVKKDAKVVVKPNVLTGRPPETATTTNPIVMATVIRMCFEAGAATVTVLDHPTVSARPAFETCGLAKATAQAGGTLKYLSDRNFEKVDIPDGKLITSWPLVADALDADVLINMPIAKTHSIAGLTMAMKNLMGIMGDSRGRIHTDFATKIVDVNTRVKPHLVVLDAYRILFRNGPTGGNLADVKMPKTVVAGTSQVSIDAYGTGFFGMAPTDLDYLVQASERGLGEIDLGRLKIQKGTA